MEFFGISGSELLLILVVGVVIIGPRHAAQGIMWLKKALDSLRGWSARLREETTATEEGLKVDLSAFDPRLYDPRRLVKEAVAEEMELWMQAASETSKNAPYESSPEKTIPESLKLFEPQLQALEDKRRSEQAAAEGSPTGDETETSTGNNTDTENKLN